MGLLETNEVYWKAVAFDCYKNETDKDSSLN